MRYFPTPSPDGQFECVCVGPVSDPNLDPHTAAHAKKKYAFCIDTTTCTSHFRMAILMVQEVRHLVASEASIRGRPQSNDCPSPAERGIRKPFDRLPELALSDEALPDSGAGLLLGDKDLSL